MPRKKSRSELSDADMSDLEAKYSHHGGQKLRRTDSSTSSFRGEDEQSEYGHVDHDDDTRSEYSHVDRDVDTRSEYGRDDQDDDSHSMASSASSFRGRKYESVGQVDSSDFSSDDLKNMGTSHLSNLLLQYQNTDTSTMSEFDRIQHELNIENEMFGVEYNLNERIFGWCPYEFYSKGFELQTWKGFFYRSCAFLILIVIYGVGFCFFILLNQRIETCESGLMKIIDNIKNISQKGCKGQAEECTFGWKFVSFKGYVQYRLASYVCLMIPFIYIPYMTILDISNTAAKVWEKLRGQTKKINVDMIGSKNKKEYLDGGWSNGLNFCLSTTYNNHINNNSSADHEKIMLWLFFVFHIILGCFSSAFDYLLMSQDFSDNSPCSILDNSLDNIKNGIEIRLKTTGTYLFSMDIILLVFTLYYMIHQYITTTFRSEKEKEKKSIAKVAKKLTKTKKHAQLLDTLKIQKESTDRAHNEIAKLSNERYKLPRDNDLHDLLKHKMVENETRTRKEIEEMMQNSKRGGGRKQYHR